MNHQRRLILRTFGVAGFGAGAARAQAAWPSKPIRLIVPVGPGSRPGTLTHLVMEQLKGAIGSNAVHHPYKGIGPALIDVIGGQVPMSFPGLAAALPHIKSGKLRPLGVTGAARHRLVAQVPTFEELGLCGFDGVQWYGIFGPAKMPPAIVKRLDDEINKIIATKEIREKLTGEALEPMPMSPAQFGSFIAQDVSRWAKVAVARGISLD